MAPRAAKKTTTSNDPSTAERRRLQKLAHAKHLLSATPARAHTALTPSKLLAKHHGADILRKSQRKNRYLFSFPGLLAPLSGGKIGELKDLATKNPILYLDFPTGQMKLFGTIVYPKNRYLSLQFSRGGKNVMCEDYFDNMIVFSDAWWIGKKEDNPEELQLEFPKEVNMEKHAECDFKGGAGAAFKKNNEKEKSVMKHAEQEPIERESDLQDDSCDSPRYSDIMMDVDRTPTRHSARTAGKRFKFSEPSSGDDSIDNDASMSEEEEDKVAIKHPVSSLDFTTDINEEDKPKLASSNQAEKATKSILKSKDVSKSKRGPLVQATISTLFKKVENKVKEPIEKGSSAAKNRTSKKARRQKGETETEDDIEEFSSSSQDTEASDEDWAE